MIWLLAGLLVLVAENLVLKNIVWLRQKIAPAPPARRRALFFAADKNIRMITDENGQRWLEVRLADGQLRRVPMATPPTPEAIEKSRLLLMRNLNEEQRAEFEALRYFRVWGSLGNRYRIEAHEHFNVNVEWFGNVEPPAAVKFCLSPCAGMGRLMPIYDAMLAQKLLLEADERRFWRLASGAVNRVQIREAIFQ
jgi:hypothetical protein